VDDLLSEKEQWEMVKAWLKANGGWIVAGVAMGALGLAGWRWWEAREERLALEASGKYEQILTAFDRGDRTQALTLIGELERGYPSSPYLDQAHLAEARVNVQDGQLDKALGNLRAVLDKTRDPQLALIARLRVARVQAAQNKPDDALATLAAAKDPGAFAPRYAEARGDIQLAKGDKAAALKEYRTAREGGARGSVDVELLDLKIGDLTGGAPPAVAVASPPAKVE
jgi:predicted negative regulator of RcsB-dependent stress response